MGAPKKKKFNRRNAYKINEEIRAPMVRVVGENADADIHDIKEALDMAEQQGLDLVEISPKAKPPVCKIVDFNKFLYEQKKKEKEMKAKSAKVEVKEIRLGPNTDDHDFNFKKNHAHKFLENGAKVKVDVFFKGRSIIHKDKGKYQLLRFAQELEEVGKVERMPRMEGKRLIMILAPKKAK